jgi:glyoxylase-like metal-dependent hydrolase (beta-lactamase superfamily II)
MLAEVADGVFVRQSAFCQTNSLVVRVDDGLILIDPGVNGDDLSGLADDIHALTGAVVAGLATHPHWDHVLWHERFGLDVPRYATPTGAAVSKERRRSLRDQTARFAAGAPLDLVAQVDPIVDWARWREWGLRLIVHQAHAPGHAAVVVELLSPATCCPT